MTSVPPAGLRSGTKIVPLAVQREADSVTRRTGTVPRIDHPSPTTIRVIHISGTLRVEAVYEYGSRGWQRSAHHLLRNGVRQQCTTDVWGKYHALSERLGPDGEFALPGIVPCREELLPADMRQSLAVMRRHLAGKPGVLLSTGRDARGRYVLALTSAEYSLHMLFEPWRRNGGLSARPVKVDPCRLVTADGEDLTEEINGKLRKALARFSGDPSDTDETGTGGAQDAQAGGPSSRKGTVLRL